MLPTHLGCDSVKDVLPIFESDTAFQLCQQYLRIGIWDTFYVPTHDTFEITWPSQPSEYKQA